jgi:hypothetical protein
VTHYHTAYGFPRHGLSWTDDEHETIEAAWLAVGEIVKENWLQDKAQILNGERHGNVKWSYARAAQLCLSAHLPANSSFEIPALNSDNDAMSYGVISCDEKHVTCSVTMITVDLTC